MAAHLSRWKPKLTEQDIEDIRADKTSTPHQLAMRYRVSERIIEQIKYKR